MQPSLGRVVIVEGIPPETNNGATVAPAMIVRVWNEDLVNVKVILDQHHNVWLTSIKLYDSKEYAEEVRAVTEDTSPFAYWPTRV